VATECERKFIVDRLPSSTALGDGVHLRQGYLAEENGLELRVRIMEPAGSGPSGSSAVLTVKAGSGRSRTEVETGVAVDEAELLWPFTLGRRIDKIRYCVPLDAHVAEVDVYAGELAGLLTVEVEFESEDAADAFTPPDWFGRELTGQAQWSNAALARHGLPSG
jgi:CYTH domain-containing protein